MYVLNIYNFCFKHSHSQNNSDSCYHKGIFNIHRCVQVQPGRCNTSNLFLQCDLHSFNHQEFKTTPGTFYPNATNLNLTYYDLTKINIKTYIKYAVKCY